MSVLLFTIVLLFLFHIDDQVTILIKSNLEIFLSHSWSCKFDVVALLVSNTLIAGAVALDLSIHSLSKKSLKILGNQFWLTVLLEGTIIKISYF